MCVRGLFMLLKIDHLTDYSWFAISKDILSAINKIFELYTGKENDKLWMFVKAIP